jgi:hypothetical protein
LEVHAVRIEGTGGPIGYADDPDLLNGVLTTDDYEKPAGRRAVCANPKCGKPFWSRGEGDIFCSEACDLDANKHYRGGRK